MKSDIKNVSPTRKEITIEVDADRLKDAYGRVSQKYAQRAAVPGFRKGNAPLDVVRLRFKEEIRSEVLQYVLPNVVTEAIQEHELHPLSEPVIHLENTESAKVNGSEPLSVHVHVEVMPEVGEPKYTDIELTRRVRPVNESTVQQIIEDRVQREAALIPVEGRKSEIGDTVIVDLEGTFADDPDGEPIKAEDLEIVLGDGSIESSFTDNLVGVTDDEEKEFTVTYAGDFSSEALAGKTVNYKAKIKSVGRTEVPELNDDWARSLDEGYESLDELREKVRSDVQILCETDANARVRNDAVAKVIEDNPLEIPITLIENQARRLLNDFARDLHQRGVDLKRVESEFVEMAYNNMRQQAERDVRGAILLDRISGLENVEVTDTEVDQELGRLAEQYRSTPDEIREAMEKDGGIDTVRHNVKTRKTIEAIVAKAKVAEGEWIDESAAEAEEEEKPKPKAKRKKAAKEGGES